MIQFKYWKFGGEEASWQKEFKAQNKSWRTNRP